MSGAEKSIEEGVDRTQGDKEGRTIWGEVENVREGQTKEPAKGTGSVKLRFGKSKNRVNIRRIDNVDPGGDRDSLNVVEEEG